MSEYDNVNMDLQTAAEGVQGWRWRHLRWQIILDL